MGSRGQGWASSRRKGRTETDARDEQDVSPVRDLAGLISKQISQSASKSVSQTSPLSRISPA